MRITCQVCNKEYEITEEIRLQALSGDVLLECVCGEFLLSNNNSLNLSFSEISYTPEYKETSDIPDDLYDEINSIQWDKKFVVTRDFLNHERDQVQELIESHGGTFQKDVTLKTDYLIIGEDELYSLMTGKATKAVRYRKTKNPTLKIIKESTFLQFITK